MISVVENSSLVKATSSTLRLRMNAVDAISFNVSLSKLSLKKSEEIMVACTGEEFWLVMKNGEVKLFIVDRGQ